MHTEIENTTLETKVDFLKHSFNGMVAATKGRTFMSLGRKYLDLDWFTGTQIKEKHSIGYRKYLNYKFLNNRLSDGVDYVGNVVSTDRINGFSEAVYTQLVWYKFKEPLTYAQVAAVTELKWNDIFKSIMAIEAPPITGMSAEDDSDSGIEEDGQQLTMQQVYNYVDNKVSAEVKKLRPVVVRIGERPEVKVEGRAHCAFAETLDAAVLEKQVFLSGPAGTGKTTLAEQVAEALDLDFGFISCSVGMSESHLLGRPTAQGGYIETSFVHLFENGGVFLFDEVDAADSNTMLVINSALGSTKGKLSIPNRMDKPYAKRHENFYCICAANTWGYGSNEYVGRNVLDAAFLDRFVMSKIEVNYDLDLEAEIANEFPLFIEAVKTMRANTALNRTRRPVSTRLVISGARALMSGKSLKKVLDMFMVGWSQEEKTKTLTGVVVA